MNSKTELVDACKRILWLEQEMRNSYASYRGLLKDEALLLAIKQIEDDEIRHINMSERILSILQK